MTTPESSPSPDQSKKEEMDPVFKEYRQTFVEAQRFVSARMHALYTITGETVYQECMDMYWNGVELKAGAIKHTWSMMNDVYSHRRRYSSFSSIFLWQGALLQLKVDIIDLSYQLLIQLQWVLKNMIADIDKLQKDILLDTTPEDFQLLCHIFAKDYLPTIMDEITYAIYAVRHRGDHHLYNFFKIRKHTHPNVPETSEPDEIVHEKKPWYICC